MASKNVMVGTGAALAGLSGLAVAAVTTNPPDPKPAAKQVAPVVETQTVVIRKVEHRVRRIKPRRHAQAAAPAAAAAAARVIRAAAPVIQAAPVVQTIPATTYAPSTAPIRTRTSGSSSHDGGRERGGHDDAAEHADD